MQSVKARRGAAPGRITALLAAAGAARAAYAGMVRAQRRTPGHHLPPQHAAPYQRSPCDRPSGRALRERRNARGRLVDLCSGPAAAAAAAATAPAVGTAPTLTRRTRAAAVLAVPAGAGCGLYDDIAGAGDGRRGFTAHWRAVREGEVTSGAVKLLGIGAAGPAAGALLKDRAADRVLAGVVIAGSAHLVNLLDVRPGRAAKGVPVVGVPGLLGAGAAAVLAAAPVGAAAALLGEDLAEHTMLGDCGAHALGAALGVSIAAARGRTGLAPHAGALVALTAVGDRVSGGAVWEKPVLRWADGLGRLPEGDRP
ncbi:hypothetical protein [Wenjunlia tyrosinilytica]|uniref:hypothetical protein n=1 Tax=Wenjunlia tyrosinilytica TaxID=1544741 RepID=UPI001E4DFC2C|nr:hypothetical protein [Wenjunlia tyrosinilytica]